MLGTTILGNPHIVKISDGSSCGFLLLNLEVARHPHVIKNFREDVSTNDTTIHGKSLVNFTKMAPQKNNARKFHDKLQSKIEDKEVSISNRSFILVSLVLIYHLPRQYNHIILKTNQFSLRFSWAPAGRSQAKKHHQLVTLENLGNKCPNLTRRS